MRASPQLLSWFVVVLLALPLSAHDGGIDVTSRIDPSALSVQPDETDASLGIALIDIRRGQLASGVQQLQGLVDRVEDREAKSRIDQELERARAFVALRDAHVRDLIQRGKPCKFEYEGETIVALITDFTGSELILGANTRGLTRVSVDVLDPYRIAREANKQIGRGRGDWARSYMFVLAGDPTGAAPLDPHTREASALRNDARNWYPRMLRLGAAAQTLDGLAAKGVPNETAGAAVCLETIRALREKFGDLEFVQRRFGMLRSLASCALELEFDPANLTSASRGKLEALTDGRVRITYDFSRPDQLLDFAPDDNYWSAWRARLPGLDDVRPGIQVLGGALRINGAICLRHVWPFEAPLVLRAKYSFDGLMDDSGTSPIFFLGACDDRADSFVRCESFGNLEARDAATSFRRTAASRVAREFEENLPRELEFSISDGEAVSKVDGATTCHVDAGPRSSGGVLLFVHSQPVIAFDRLVIEGKPDLDALRARWIEDRLSALRL